MSFRLMLIWDSTIQTCIIKYIPKFPKFFKFIIIYIKILNVSYKSNTHVQQEININIKLPKI